MLTAQFQTAEQYEELTEVYSSTVTINCRTAAQTYSQSIVFEATAPSGPWPPHSQGF